MQVTISTNLANQAGLEREYTFLRGALESYGHTVHGHQFNDPKPPPQADLAIYIEVIAECVLETAREHWFIPHSEWTFDNLWARFYPRFSKIICKTRDCVRIWSAKVPPAKCVYTGWESLDFYQPSIKKLPAFLHLPGKSQTRQTDVVGLAWKNHRVSYPLAIVTAIPEIAKRLEGIPNVTILSRLSEEQLATMMNECQFILCPSKYEGFGHVIHEAIGCGAVVLTTNAPPMNEFNGIDRQMLISSYRRDPWRAAAANIVAPQAIADVVNRAARLPAERIMEISNNARQAFLKDRDDFRMRFQELMKCVC